MEKGSRKSNANLRSVKTTVGEIVATTLTSRREKNPLFFFFFSIDKQIFETRIKIEQESKLSEIVATKLTSRYNTGPAGAVAVVPILLPRDFFIVYPDFFPFF